MAAKRPLGKAVIELAQRRGRRAGDNAARNASGQAGRASASSCHCSRLEAGKQMHGHTTPLGAAFWWREERRTRDAGRRRRRRAIDARSRLGDCGQLVMYRLCCMTGLTAADLAPRTRSGNWCDSSRVRASRGDRDFSRAGCSTCAVRRTVHCRTTRDSREQRVERRTPQAPYCDQHGGCPDEAQSR